MTSCFAPVAELDAVTFTFGMTAPVASVTCPAREPELPWARATALNNRPAIATYNVNRIFADIRETSRILIKNMAASACGMHPTEPALSRRADRNALDYRKESVARQIQPAIRQDSRR